MKPEESNSSNNYTTPKETHVTSREVTDTNSKPALSSLSKRKRKEYSSREISHLNSLLVLWVLVKIIMVLLSNTKWFVAAAKATTTTTTRLAFQHQHQPSCNRLGQRGHSRLGLLGGCDETRNYVQPSQQQVPSLLLGGGPTIAQDPRQYPFLQPSRFLSSAFSRKNGRLSSSNRNNSENDYDDDYDDEDTYVPPQQEFDPIAVGTPVLVEVAYFGPLGASVHVVAKSHNPQDLPPPEADEEEWPIFGVGLITQQELAYHRDARRGVEVVLGEVLPAYIERAGRLDGKLGITLRAFGGKQKAMDVSQQILDSMQDGVLALGDKSDPADIAAVFPGVSKATFKKAVSALFKQGLLLKPQPLEIQLNPNPEPQQPPPQSERRPQPPRSDRPPRQQQPSMRERPRTERPRNNNPRRR